MLSSKVPTLACSLHTRLACRVVHCTLVSWSKPSLIGISLRLILHPALSVTSQSSLAQLYSLFALPATYANKQTMHSIIRTPLVQSQFKMECS